MSRDEKKKGIEGPARAALAAGVAAALMLGGCSVTPSQLGEEEQATLLEQDRGALFADQEPVSGPIDLYEAMARAIKYNLDHRLKAMEAAVSQKQLDVARYDMLPQLAVDAGYEGRDDQAFVSSEDLFGIQSLRPSTSSDRERDTAKLGVSWNVLDFGVSYVRAQQQADRSLIAEERRRKVIHNIIQEVRSAYWRAVSAQRLLARIDPLLERVSAARDDARAIEQRKLRSPMEALTYQRSLLDTLRQLHIMRRELMLAKTQLAALMNLAPDQHYEVVVPNGASQFQIPEVGKTVQELERLALANRPELREEAYQSRISAAETRKAMLELLPGLRFNYDWNYDSNSYLYDEDWSSYGLRVTWNLLNLFSAKDRMGLAETMQEMGKTRRLALNMAVMTQVHVAYLRFNQAAREFDVARDMSDVEDRILQQLKMGAKLKRRSGLELIRGELDQLVGEMRRDIAYAELNNAQGRLLVSVGADPLPDTLVADDVATVAKAIETRIGGLEK